jgi:hypothetical protein
MEEIDDIEVAREVLADDPNRWDTLSSNVRMRLMLADDVWWPY